MIRPTLTISETVELDLSPAVAWDRLSNPSSVAGCVPGATITSIDEDGTIHGELTMSLGPSSVTFRGRLVAEFDEAEHSGVLTGAASDSRTKAQLETTFRVEEVPETDRCRLVVDADIAVNGALAGFARAGGGALAARMLADFAENLAREARTTTPSDAAAPTGRLSALSLVFRSLRDALSRLVRRPATRGGRQNHDSETR